MKIVVLDGNSLNPGDLSWGRLEQMGGFTVYDRTPKELIEERISDAEIVFTNKTPLRREVLEKAASLKYIGVLATGYNIVDTDAARDLGITVTNVPTYGTAAVAQFTFALLLELCHHVWAHSEQVRNGAWSSCPDFCFWNYPLIELAGKTMGIIGFGRIGRSVAAIAQAMGMKVIAYSRTMADGQAGVKSMQDDAKSVQDDTKSVQAVVKFVRLDELLSASDVISLHCPLFDSNKGMINKETIAKMKDGAMLINTARGPLIVEEDLAEALNSGKLAGAAVDVVSREPVKADNPLLKARNCIITPHIAWAPRESRERLMNVAADNLSSFLSGKAVNVVNPQIK